VQPSLVRQFTDPRAEITALVPTIVFQCRREAFYQTEKAVTTGLNVSAMLKVVARPIALGSHIITLVEQRIERLEDQCFVFR
jgi:hypothetical protein